MLTHDWHWTTYDSIAVEQGRTVETFDMFNDKGEFNLEDFEYKVSKLLRIQDRVLIILNTPANNPTGYSLSDKEWEQVVAILNKTGDDKTVALCVDVAYIDFAGETDETRTFLPYLEKLNSNIMPAAGIQRIQDLHLLRMQIRCPHVPCRDRRGKGRV